VIIVTITAYNLRSTGKEPEQTGDLLTRTSERTVKRIILESLDDTIEYNLTMAQTVQDSAMMVCYRECLSNLEKFNGGEEQKVIQFINNIERIGRMINANDNILHCMCTAKLDGEAKRWYEDNASLNQWETFKLTLLERFTLSDPSARAFEQLKERKQRPDETVTSYYDAVIKLCHEYDDSMSQKMMISWLENGIKESLKTQIKRQMKLLPETDRTTQAFLKIAKDEQELEGERLPETEPTSAHLPYFTQTVSTTLPEARDTPSAIMDRPYPSRTGTIHSFKSGYQRRKQWNESKLPSPRYQQHSTASKSRLPTSLYDAYQPKSKDTMDCYYKKPYGCYKCGQSEHRIRDCPEVFY
jgi:Retrotransposon gag protein/Zinc knuckle